MQEKVVLNIENKVKLSERYSFIIIGNYTKSFLRNELKKFVGSNVHITSLNRQNKKRFRIYLPPAIDEKFQDLMTQLQSLLGKKEINFEEIEKVIRERTPFN